MKKESLIVFPNSYFSKISGKAPRKRVVIGFNENMCGQTIVTTAIPAYYKADEVSFIKEKTLSYEDYLYQTQQKSVKSIIKK